MSMNLRSLVANVTSFACISDVSKNICFVYRENPEKLPRNCCKTIGPSQQHNSRWRCAASAQPRKPATLKPTTASHLKRLSYAFLNETDNKRKLNANRENEDADGSSRTDRWHVNPESFVSADVEVLSAPSADF